MSDQTNTRRSERPALVDELGAIFDHVAVAAPRIRDLLKTYRDLLSGRYLGGGDNTRTGYRACQFQYMGGRVELMEPLRGSSFFDSFFQRGSGLHHMTFKVPDIDAAIGRLEALDYTPTGVHLNDPQRQEIFVHPRESDGALIQLVQTSLDITDRTGRHTVDDLLAGHGWNGNGEPSP